MFPRNVLYQESAIMNDETMNVKCSLYLDLYFIKIQLY